MVNVMANVLPVMLLTAVMWGRSSMAGSMTHDQVSMMRTEMANHQVSEDSYMNQDYGAQQGYGYQQAPYGYQPAYGQPQPVGYDTYTLAPPQYGHQVLPYSYPQHEYRPVYMKFTGDENSSEGSTESEEMGPKKMKNLKEMLKMDEEEKKEMTNKEDEEMKKGENVKMKEEMKEMSAKEENMVIVPDVPACAHNTSRSWCDADEGYPRTYIQQAIEYHFHNFLNLYADVEDLDTISSVDRATTLAEETYLCSSSTAYIKPVYAKNTEGRWRMIVNNIELHYKMITQTARVEECTKPGEDCPLVPHCYFSKCLQKHNYHRFLVFDEADPYFPFVVESFKLPLACSCKIDAYEFDH